jgi:hypothetical protein
VAAAELQQRCNRDATGLDFWQKGSERTCGKRELLYYYFTTLYYLTTTCGKREANEGEVSNRTLMRDQEDDARSASSKKCSKLVIYRDMDIDLYTYVYISHTHTHIT